MRTFPRKAEESFWILERIKESKAYQEASVILAFSPLPSEPDISPLLDDERVLLPYLKDGIMFFGSPKKLQRNPYGFWEPQEQEEIAYEKAVMLVPMLGFDDSLMRLGRGGGYYDKYLSLHSHQIYTIGVAFSVSRITSVPAEWNDRRLDEIIHL